jgi:hypothetical protein
MKTFSKIAIVLLPLLAGITFSCKKELAPLSLKSKSTSLLSSDSVGSVTTLAHLQGAATGLAVDAAHNLYTASWGTRYDIQDFGEIYKITPAGVVTPFANAGGGAQDITFGPDSALYVTNFDLIIKITLSGVVTTFAGVAVPGSIQQDVYLFGITSCAEGNLYVTSRTSPYVPYSNLGDQSIRVITPGAGSIVYTLYKPGPITVYQGIAIYQGSVYFSDDGNTIAKIAPDGTLSTFATGIAAYDLAFDSSGNLYASDNAHHKIMKIAPDGVVSTLAGSGTAVSADGVGANASFSDPRGLAIDGDILYVADGTPYSTTSYNTIRKIVIK